MTKNDEEKNNFSIDDIEFQDAVISIPANAIYIKQEVRTCENDKIITLLSTYSLKDIRGMFDLFEQTIDGDYPKYVVTEKGMRSLEESWEDYRDDDRWDTSDRD